ARVAGVPDRRVGGGVLGPVDAVVGVAAGGAQGRVKDRHLEGADVGDVGVDQGQGRPGGVGLRGGGAGRGVGGGGGRGGGGGGGGWGDCGGGRWGRLGENALVRLNRRRFWNPQNPRLPRRAVDDPGVDRAVAAGHIDDGGVNGIDGDFRDSLAGEGIGGG